MEKTVWPVVNFINVMLDKLDNNVFREVNVVVFLLLNRCRRMTRDQLWVSPYLQSVRAKNLSPLTLCAGSETLGPQALAFCLTTLLARFRSTHIVPHTAASSK